MDAGREKQSRWWGTPSINLGARQPISHAIMFYVLALASLAIFAPCVLVPVWMDVQKLHEDEQELAAVIAQLRHQIDRNNDRIVALQADPQVIERVARRELNRQPADEQLIKWSSAELAAVPDTSHLVTVSAPEVPAITLPEWMTAVGRWLPGWASPDLFAKSPNREMMLVMSAALLLAAFVLYTPKTESRIDRDM